MSTQVQSLADLQAQIEKLKAEKAALLKANGRPLTVKISRKGAVSVYGLGRFPVTLYRSQWDRLIKSMADIQGFIEGNVDAIVQAEEQGKLMADDESMN
jgi:hypothetical protein